MAVPVELATAIPLIDRFQVGKYYYSCYTVAGQEKSTFHFSFALLDIEK